MVLSLHLNVLRRSNTAIVYGSDDSLPVVIAMNRLSISDIDRDMVDTTAAIIVINQVSGRWRIRVISILTRVLIRP